MKKLLSCLFASALLFPFTVHADITIGVYGPLTGPVASISDYWKPGVSQAVEDINARGGVLGQKLKLEIMDDACDPRQSVAAVNRLIAMNVSAIVTPSCSGSIMAAAPVADEAGIPQIVGHALNSGITDHGWSTVFRVSGRDADQAKAAVAVILKKVPGKKNIAILHDKSAFCRGLADIVQQELDQAGVRDAKLTDVNPGENDFSSTITRFKQEGVNVVFLSFYQREAGLFVRQAKEQKLDAFYIGSNLLSLPEYRQIAGDKTEDTHYVRQSMPVLSDVTLYTRLKKWGPEPAVYTYLDYSAVEILAQAMEQAKSSNPAKIQEALRKGRFMTVFGPITFDEKGNFSPVIHSYHWHEQMVVEGE